MTPREFVREGYAAQQRWQDDAERDLARAWHTAMLTERALAGKLPSLTTMLDRSKIARRAEMALGEMQTQLTALLGQPHVASAATLAALRRPQEQHG